MVRVILELFNQCLAADDQHNKAQIHAEVSWELISTEPHLRRY